MKITEFAEKYDMFPREGTVLCALSGGRDSMCLLHILLELAPEYGFSVACAHYNHRLRGGESDRDARFVKEYCARLGIPVYVGSGDVNAFSREKGLSVEEAARELRYAFLEQTADEIGATKIATAHNAEDNAETVLLNLIRGSGLSGLGGIPPVRGRIIRPLLKTTRAEIESYLEEKGIPHVEDSTNAKDDYSRNRLRHGVLPVLRELNPAFVQNVSRTADLLREDEEFIAGQARDFIQKNLRKKGESATLPAGLLAELPNPVSARVFKLVAGSGLSAVHIEALRQLCRSEDPSASLDLPGMRVIREYDKVVFSPPKWEKIRERVISPGETVEIPEAELKIKCEYF
jgi:tRNA(Ile)-lysidine synthase